MDLDPGESAEARQDSDAHDVRTPAEGSRRERYGPVTLERNVKDDGRALLIYTRTGADPG